MEMKSLKIKTPTVVPTKVSSLDPKTQSHPWRYLLTLFLVVSFDYGKLWKRSTTPLPRHGELINLLINIIRPVSFNKGGSTSNETIHGSEGWLESIKSTAYLIFFSTKFFRREEFN